MFPRRGTDTCTWLCFDIVNMLTNQFLVTPTNFLFEPELWSNYIPNTPIRSND